MNISKKEAIDTIAQIMFSHLKQKDVSLNECIKDKRNNQN